MRLHIYGLMLIVTFLYGCATQQPSETKVITSEFNVVGDWNLIANNNPGKLEIRESNGILAGRVWFDKHKRWEILTRLGLNGNTLQFDRGHQKFTAEYNGGKLIGTFVTLGRSYNWSANRL